jgi:hypothetical protein
MHDNVLCCMLSGAEGAFLSALVSELKRSGSLSLSALATKVMTDTGLA